MTRDDIYSAIFEEYDNDRENAERRARALKRKLYDKDPRLEEIDSEIMQKGVELFRASVSGRDNAEQKEKFRLKINALNREKDYILKNMGYSLKALEPQYKCDICKDRGFVGSERCQCFNIRLADRLYDLSNIGPMLENENFDSFDYSRFSKEKGKDGISPYDNIMKIVMDAMGAIDYIDEKPLHMLFYGNSGLGKTFMCNCIAKSLIDRGYFVVYMSAYKLFSYMLRFRFGRETDKEAEAIKLLNECDLLVIDDLGTEGVNAGTIPELFDIINTRLLNNKSILISTNLSPSDISKTYSERIFSRITGDFSIYKFIGNDMRLK